MTQKRGAKPLAFEKVSLRSVPSCPSKRTTRHSLRAKNFSDAHVVRKKILISFASADAWAAVSSFAALRMPRTPCR